MSSAVTDSKRRALGKGLDSLLPRVQAAAAVQQPTAEIPTGKPREIPVDHLDVNPYQTRAAMDAEHLKDLAASIAANGVVQPVLVRPLPNGRFQLIAGERRWRASILANKKTIPAILRQVSDEQAMEITIVENLQREDLNPLEQARAFDRLGREFHMTQEQMAVRTGKDRATITNYLRLLKLPANVQSALEKGELSMGHAKALLMLDAGEIETAASRALALSLNVRQTETMVQNQIAPDKAKKAPKPEPELDPNVREVKDQLQRALGLKVRIEDKNGRGRVIIEYSKLEDFDGLLEQLAGTGA